MKCDTSSWTRKANFWWLKKIKRTITIPKLFLNFRSLFIFLLHGIALILFSFQHWYNKIKIVFSSSASSLFCHRLNMTHPHISTYTSTLNHWKPQIINIKAPFVPSNAHFEPYMPSSRGYLVLFTWTVTAESRAKRKQNLKSPDSSATIKAFISAHVKPFFACLSFVRCVCELKQNDMQKSHHHQSVLGIFNRERDTGFSTSATVSTKFMAVFVLFYLFQQSRSLARRACYVRRSRW